jgi:hypothetical protein
MRTTNGPQRLVVLEVRAGISFSVFRIVRSDNPDDPVFLNSLRSRYELSEEPRKVERNSTVIHMRISVHMERGDSAATARKFPKLGDYTARLALRPGMGFNYAHTAMPGHLTLWAEPIKLRDVLVDIEPVES